LYCIRYKKMVILTELCRSLFSHIFRGGLADILQLLMPYYLAFRLIWTDRACAAPCYHGYCLPGPGQPTMYSIPSQDNYGPLTHHAQAEVILPSVCASPLTINTCQAIDEGEPTAYAVEVQYHPLYGVPNGWPVGRAELIFP
jgi:hypothetical protein